MKITFIEDKDKIYSEDLIHHLRSYNQSKTGEVEFDQSYIYALEDNQLVGALVVVYFWDWVSIKHVFYKNQSVLNTLVDVGWQKYGEKAMGIKLVTPVIDRWRDFLLAGFTPTGAVNLTKNYNYYYADYTSGIKHDNKTYEIIVKSTEEPKYQEILEKEYKDFNDKNRITGKLDEINWVALDNKKFVGGINCEIYEDSLYISHIVVLDEYRYRNIGSKLLEIAEAIGKEKKLDLCQLGTCEFQAKPFYEKNGYRVVHTRNDNPKGFKSFTMFKDL
ncbi:MAG: GNAT family N-acetyltransferase [Candidatus Izemoplasmatales bacterium]